MICFIEPLGTNCLYGTVFNQVYTNAGHLCKSYIHIIINNIQYNKLHVHCCRKGIAQWVNLMSWRIIVDSNTCT